MQVCFTYTRTGSWKDTFDYVLPGAIHFSCRSTSCSMDSLKTSTAGTYIFESSEVRMARLLLQRTYWKSIPRTARPKKDSQPTLVRVPKDLLALDVQLSMPNRSMYSLRPILILGQFFLSFLLVELGQPPTILVSVFSGRNDVSRVTVGLSASSITFWPKDAFLYGGICDVYVCGPFQLIVFNIDSKSVSMEIQPGSNYISLSAIPKETTISIMVPHSDNSNFQAMVNCRRPR